MKENLNYGVILKHLRMHYGFTYREFAKRIGRSKGWLSDVERGTGRCHLYEDEFNRIVETLGAAKLRPMFRTWAANNKKFEHVDRSMEGAVLKHVRNKSRLRLVDVAKKVGLSPSQLSKIENGSKAPTVELRKRVLQACGYSPASFKNLYADPERSKAVPYKYKLKIILRSLPEDRFEEIFKFVEALIEEHRLKISGSQEGAK